MDGSLPSGVREARLFRAGRARPVFFNRCLKARYHDSSKQDLSGKRQNQLTEAHIAKIIETYQFRKKEMRYSRRVEMAEIEKNDFNLNISRYISTAVGAAEIDLQATHVELVEIEKAIAAAKLKHNDFLKELGLSPLP